MRFKNTMSFKAKIKQVALEKGIMPQLVQQNYLIEAFLTKLSKSAYQSNFIIKGGYLIGGIMGLDLRATMDLDTTIVGIDLKYVDLISIVKEITETPSDSAFKFTFSNIEEIRENNDSLGYKVKLKAEFENIREVVTVDITQDDVITPREIDFNFRKTFSDEEIRLMSYPIETVLAEKLETILSRGIVTTRPRDYYDVYILFKFKSKQIDFKMLKKALNNTINRRKSIANVNDFNLILNDIARITNNYQELYQLTTTKNIKQSAKTHGYYKNILCFS